MRNSKRLLAFILALALVCPAQALATITHIAGVGADASTSSGTVLTFTVDESFAVGEIFIMLVGFDNTGTTDADHNEISSITGTQTNSWTKLCEFTNGQTAAAAGVTAAIYMSRITTPLTAAVDTITVNFANTITAKSHHSRKFTVGAGNTLQKVGTCQTEVPDGTTDPGSLAVSGLATEEHLCLRAHVQETDATTNMVPTTDWSLISDVVADVGAASDSIRTDGEYRIHTADNCTSDPSTSHTDADGVSLLVALKEIRLGGSSSLLGVGR